MENLTLVQGSLDLKGLGDFDRSLISPWSSPVDQALERPMGIPREHQFRDQWPALKIELDRWLTESALRPADACNVLMVAAGAKETCLAVFYDENQCVSFAQAMNDFVSACGVTSAIHYDPEVKAFYYICCTDPNDASLLNHLNETHCEKNDRLHPQVEQVIPSAEYHLKLGKFLKVPDCCLFENPVMPDQANRIFDSILSRIQESPGQNEALHEMRFSPHLPCCAGCDKTPEIGRSLRDWLSQNAPEYVDRLVSARQTVPLYLY